MDKFTSISFRLIEAICVIPFKYLQSAGNWTVYEKLTICCVRCLVFSGTTSSTKKHVPSSVTTTQRVDRKEGVLAFFWNINKPIEYFLQYSRSPISVTTFFFVFVVILVFQLPVTYHFSHLFFFVISSVIRLPFPQGIVLTLNEEYISPLFLASSKEWFFSSFSYLALHRFFFFKNP